MAVSQKAALLNRLLDAARECQTQYSGNGQIMTERNSSVSCVCRQFEEVLSHGLKRKQAPSSLYTLQNVTGLQLLDQQYPEPVFWHLIQKHLSRHELDRFSNLYHITSDVGKGRAWLRSALNEHSLERMLQMILGDAVTLQTFYSADAFMLDEDKSGMLPQIAGDLKSVMFSIKIDDPALNNSLNIINAKSERGAGQLLGGVISIPSFGQVTNLLGAEVGMEEFPEAALHSSSAPSGGFKGQKKEKKKTKKTKIIKFSHSGQQLPVEVTSKRENYRPHSSLSSESKGRHSFSDDVIIPNDIATKDSDRLTGKLLAQESAGISSSKIQPHKDSDTAPYFAAGTASDDQSSIYANSMPNVPSYGSYISNSTSHSNADSEFDDQPSNNIEPNGVDAIDLSDDEGSIDIAKDENFMLELRFDAGSEVSSLDNCSSASVDGAVLNLPEEIDSQLDKSTADAEPKTDGLFAENVSSVSPSKLPAYSPKFSSPKLVETEQEGNNDLQKALVVLLQRKDELVEETKVLRDLLDTETTRSTELHDENEKLKVELEEFMQSNSIDNKRQLQENEVLRSQLKRYVGAVQALQQGKVSGEPILSEEEPVSEDQAGCGTSLGEIDEKMYERKLIEVTEMHGELIEFTEALNTRFLSALALIHKMHDELVALRGPLPTDNVIKALEADRQTFNLSSLPSLPRALINVWVPSAFMQGSGPESHHVYQIYTCFGDDEWNVYRRYSDFYVLHNSLIKPFPDVKKFGFPRKKNIGNRNSKIVEERRKAFQSYLRLVMHTLIQKNSRLAADPTKKTLVHILPFFSDSDSQCRVIVGKHK